MSAATPRSTLRLLAPGLFGLLVLVLWQIACRALEVPIYLVPAPTDVAATLVRDWTILWHALLVTLEITGLSFLLAVVLGSGMAFLFVQSRVLEQMLFPYVILLQVTPIVAIAPLIIIWVKNTTVALVLCATIVALFPIVANTSLGLRSVSPGLLDLFRVHQATRWQTLTRLRIPSALPYFFGGLRISSGLALIGAVTAELVAGTGGSGSGLAYQLLQAGLQLNIPRLFAALVLLALTGVVLFALMARLTRAVLGRWHESEFRR